MTRQEFDFFKQFTDPKQCKSQVQTYALKKVIEKSQRASLFMSPGSGKTRCGIISTCENIKRYGGKGLLTVPKENLIEQWNLEAIQWGYGKLWENVTCICHNSNYKIDFSLYDYFVIDEAHLSIHGESFGSILDYDFEANNKKLLCLTGTKPDNKEDLTKLLSVAPLAFELTLAEAVELKLVSNYIINVIDVKLTTEEQIKYNKAQKSFVYNKQILGNFDAFERSKEILADKDAPQKDKQAASLFLAAMRNRKAVTQNASNKLIVAKQILDLYPNNYTITFSETNSFTTNLHKLCKERAVIFHSKMKEKERDQALILFADRKTEKNIINSTRALSEGYNVPVIDMGVITAFTSKSNTIIQRITRACRYIEGKRAIIFILVVPNTQEELWLKNALSSVSNVRNFDSLNTCKQTI